MPHALEHPAEYAPMEVIDLKEEDESALAGKMRKACAEAGFFFLSNHGVPRHVIDDAYAQLKAFFDLSLEQKRETLQSIILSNSSFPDVLFSPFPPAFSRNSKKDGNNRGYAPSQEEILDAANQKKGDTKETFHVGVEIPENDERAKLPLRGPNIWPDKALLPHFRPAMLSYFSHLHSLSLRLLPLLALSLSLPRSFFLSPGMFDEPMEVLRLIRYDLGEGSDPGEGVFGCGAHSDYGMLTLLLTDGEGLQICRNKFSPEAKRVWQSVPRFPSGTTSPLPDDASPYFVVNLGDMLERWSNGLFSSTLHRVCTETGRRKHSLVFFFEPNFDCMVECLPSCKGEGEKFPPIKSGDWLLRRLRDTHTGLDMERVESGI